MTERIKCKTEGCSGTILPETAVRTGGYCMPCVQAAAKRERDEYIRLNRRDYNPFDGISDPVEVLKVIHKPRVYDPLVNWIPYPVPTDQLYQSLTADEQARLARYAQSLIRSEGQGEADSILLCLAAFTDACLDAALRALAEHGHFRSPLTFDRAPVDVRDDLIARVDWDQKNRNHILLVLAWIGDPVVVDLFAGWQRRPPAWSSSLSVPLADYSKEAGWEIKEGRRHELYFQTCRSLVKGPSSRPEVFQAITDSDDTCPWCRHLLTDLFTFEPGILAIADAKTERVQITTCEICTGFGIVYGQMSEQGHGRWHVGNSRPDYLPDDSDDWDRLPRNPLELGESRSPLFAANQFLPTTFSQIGGHPTWIQDACYPICQECSETMMFVAQADCGDFTEGEGLYYAFVCLNCRSTATVYQQT